MKSEYQLESAQDLKPEIFESIRMAFGDAPIRITIEEMTASSRKSPKNTTQSKEIADTVIDMIFDQLAKKKPK